MRDRRGRAHDARVLLRRAGADGRALSGPVLAPATTREHLEAIRRFAHVVWHEHYPGIIPVAQIHYMLERRYALEVLAHELESGALRYDRALVRGEDGDEELVGYAAYGPWSDEPDGAWLQSLYVRADWRGRGCARMLLARVQGWAEARGLARIGLTVNKQNASAIAAYRRFGFRVTGPSVVDIGGGFVMDDWAMERDVASERAS